MVALSARICRLMIVVAAIVFGICAGALHLYMRFSNNTQGEMFDRSGHVDIGYSALLFLTAFAPVFCIALVCGAAVVFLIGACREKD